MSYRMKGNLTGNLMNSFLASREASPKVTRGHQRSKIDNFQHRSNYLPNWREFEPNQIPPSLGQARSPKNYKLLKNCQTLKKSTHRSLVRMIGAFSDHGISKPLLRLKIDFGFENRFRVWTSVSVEPMGNEPPFIVKRRFICT